MKRVLGLFLPAVLLVLVGGAPAHHLCATPGQDGAMPAGAGIVNTYYPPGANGTLPAGTTVIPLGLPAGAPDMIAAGNMLLIIQMQDAEIVSTNDAFYGDGVAGDPGSGSSDLHGSGLYEFLRADSVTTDGMGNLTSVTVTGGGPGGGLINAYTNEDATALRGQQRYQVVRVPQYTTAVFSSALTARAWDGSTGGLLVLDVQGQSDWNGATVDVTGLGFRGAGAQRLTGGVGVADDDYVAPSTVENHGNKGEGVAGTPRFTVQGGVAVDGGGLDGYPGGLRARGAPGNAGGGGADASSGNSEAAGGGGGGNGGVGGKGGDTSSGLPGGGFGGAAFPWSVSRIVPGGGGGSGSKNDNNTDQCHGSTGGGVVILRTGSVVGTGSLLANGTNPPLTGNDGAGGAGAGGSVILVTETGGFSGLTVQARGGNGADAGTGNSIRGPGAGGGGGVVMASAAVLSTVTPGGNSGLTDGGTTSNGATAGDGGSDVPGSAGNPFIDPDDVPGVGSGAECTTGSPPPPGARAIRDSLKAGYCGLTGFEGLALLALLRAVRSRRRR